MQPPKNQVANELCKVLFQIMKLLTITLWEGLYLKNIAFLKLKLFSK